MPNIKMEGQEFSEFIQLADFVLTIRTGKKIYKKKPAYKYHKDIGEFLGRMTPGAVGTSLFSDKLPSLSEKAFRFFCEAYQQTVSGKLTVEQASLLLKYNPLYQKWTENMEERYVTAKTSGRKERDDGQASEKLRQINDQNSKKSSKRDLMKSFDDATWYLYERHERPVGRTIGRMVMKFKTFDEHLVAGIDISHFSNKFGGWTGTASFNDADNLLIIAVRNAVTRNNYMHFLFKVEITLKKVELCVGHLTYRNKINFNVVTKTIIIARHLEAEKRATPAELKFESDEVPPVLRQFFALRERNRMSSPHRGVTVSDLTTLQEWLNQNAPLGQKGLEAVLGSYTVFYRIKPDDNNFIEDDLEIKLSETGQFVAIYKHETYKGEPKSWEGLATPNFDNGILTAYLRGPINQSLSEATSEIDLPTFLMINLPARDKIIVDTLTGIVSGNRDGMLGSVSRLLVMVQKKEGKYSEGFDAVELDNFFNYFADRSRVRPPFSKVVPAISEFIHLKKIREDYIKMSKKPPYNDDQV